MFQEKCYSIDFFLLGVSFPRILQEKFERFILKKRCVQVCYEIREKCNFRKNAVIILSIISYWTNKKFKGQNKSFKIHRLSIHKYTTRSRKELYLFT